MSSFIDVDYREFEKAASAVEDYVDRQKQKMSQANQDVASLGAGWQGQDFERLQSKWNELDNTGSTAVNLQKSLKDYADVLRYVADQYKKAQKKAIDRVNSL
ncbi:WXG100 family type VII secretion target [Neobacillus sp. GCM10023253]|uniref:WXG100 family type VII secretion target n=1 Tax=Neobacillus sp. GCM10023253 TaxID=3252644 RepID=UPI003611C38B